jgi:hypothetical protein
MEQRIFADYELPKGRLPKRRVDAGLVHVEVLAPPENLVRFVQTPVRTEPKNGFVRRAASLLPSEDFQRTTSRASQPASSGTENRTYTAGRPDERAQFRERIRTLLIYELAIPTDIPGDPLCRQIEEALAGAPLESLLASIRVKKAKILRAASYGFCLPLAISVGEAWVAGAKMRERAEMSARAREAEMAAYEADRPRREAQEAAASAAQKEAREREEKEIARAKQWPPPDFTAEHLALYKQARIDYPMLGREGLTRATREMYNDQQKKKDVAAGAAAGGKA